MATSRRDPLSRLQPLLQVVILAFGLFCLGIAQDVFIPIASAMLLTFVLSPIVERLERWRFPRVVAVVVTVALVFSVLGGLGWLLASQVTTLAADLPQYKSNLTVKMRQLRRVGKSDSLEKAQSTVKEVIGELQKDNAAAAKKAPQPVVVERPTPVGFEGLRAGLGPIAAVLATVSFVVVLVIFMLMERQRLLERLIRLAGTGRVTLTTKILTDAADRIGRYLQMQSLANTGFGLAIGTGLSLIGVPYALFFGVLSAALRFVPYIGAWVAAGSAALVSLAVFDGWREPVMVLTLFALVELAIYLVIEPLLYSHSAGVSPLALLITLAFWTWLWGPIGLILGTPLTVCLVALGRHIPEMQFITVLFGDEPVVTTDVAIYQRLLKGDETGARSVLEQYVKEHPAIDVDEAVLLPALARVRRDGTRGALTAEEATFIAGAIRRIVDDLEAEALPAARERDESAPTVPTTPSLRALACPARDDVDAAALRLLAGRVRPDGVRLELVDPGTLTAEVLERVATSEPGVVVVASLAQPGLAHVRYVLKRLRARFPDLPLVAACWSPADDAEAACAALLDAGASDIATTLGEARERILQYRQVRAEPAPTRAA
jgi:predicted PurR-regulated permease PerM/CheY-like chemotaxis protein